MDGIAFGNQLGPGIRVASLPELGPGGSWSTCLMGCSAPQPRDVAHVQFRSRIAFKLVWAPPAYSKLAGVAEAPNPLRALFCDGRVPCPACRLFCLGGRRMQLISWRHEFRGH